MEKYLQASIKHIFFSPYLMCTGTGQKNVAKTPETNKSMLVVFELKYMVHNWYIEHWDREIENMDLDNFVVQWSKKGFCRVGI